MVRSLAVTRVSLALLLVALLGAPGSTGEAATALQQTVVGPAACRAPPAELSAGQTAAEWLGAQESERHASSERPERGPARDRHANGSAGADAAWLPNDAAAVTTPRCAAIPTCKQRGQRGPPFLS
jgi:hypothetical protein